MERKNLFKKYQQRLVLEAVVKSLICGFIIGFVASIIPAIICIVFNASGLLYCLAVLLGVGAIATALFYFIMFKPTQKQIANRIDRLGLQERAVTMMEFENNDSVMAKLQREDAQARIQAANAKKIKFRIFKAPLIALAVVAVLAISMTTVSIVSVEPPVKYNSNRYIGEEEGGSGIEYLEITYQAYYPEGAEMFAGGDVNDYHSQTAVKGGDAKKVVAVPWPGYEFVVWMSENGEFFEDLERIDRRVRGSLLVYAVFMPISESDPNQATKTDEPDPIEPINTIRDGNQYYGDHFEPYHETVKEALISSGEELSAEKRAAIELYFETLRKLK